MGSSPGDEAGKQDGAEPVYGPAYGAVPVETPATGAPAPHIDGTSPPYTAPYPPYPSDVQVPGGISTPVASGLAYFTVIPAIFFLLLEPYRSDPTVRFHSWQSIFYFLAVAAVRVLELLLMSMLPSAIAFTISGLVSLALFALWLVATVKAFQGSKWLLPVVGSYAAQTASTVSTR